MSADEEARLFLALLQSVIDERMAGPHSGMDAALLELDRRQILKWAGKHFEHHVKYASSWAQRGAPMNPRHLEFRFGSARTGDSESDPESVGDAFVLEVGGERLRITGQIDRIDAGTIDGKTVFSVIDYKSGKKLALKLEHIESGERLQLPIYVEAAQCLVFGGDATPVSAGYWSAAGGFDDKGALAVVLGDSLGDEWQRVRTAVHDIVRRFVAGIRHGEFPVASRDDECTSYCDFKTVCRVTQVRSLNKLWPKEVES
jgi:ATP-dependent helicase/DNAse subunit B